MSKIKYSALVSDMRNKLNGSVLSKNRYGSYIRNKTTPVNPQTSYQMLQRSYLSALSAAWRSLTQAQRDAWTASAGQRPRTDIFGDPKILAGNALYVSANLNLLRSGNSQIDVPGELVDVPSVVAGSFTFEVDAGVLQTAQFNITPTAVPSGFKLVVYATPGMGAGISYIKNQLRYLGNFVPAAGAVDISSAYEARFGVPNIGERVFVRVALVSNTTGQLGLPSEVSTVVAQFS